MAVVPRLFAAALVATGLAAAAAPWRVARSHIALAIDGGAARSAGLTAVVKGAVTLKLLPRPRIQATDLTLTTEDGTVQVDAPLLKGELDIASLVRGRWRLSTATLVAPTVTLDVDRLAARPAASAPNSGVATPALQLRVRSAVLRTRSATPFADFLATNLDASLTWPTDEDSLVVSGAATWRGTDVQFAGNLQHAGQGFAPAGSTAGLQIESALFNLSADGVLSGGRQQQFAGRVSLSTPALPKLLRVLDGFPLALGTHRAQISGDLVARPSDLSLSNALLRLDRARFEGTLAWRREAGRGLIAGTLATDLLDVDALMGDGIDVDALYRRPLEASPFATDLDMRISATTARVGKVSVEDAAGAVLVRGNRLELTLDEARGYGGVLKARALATLDSRGIDAQGDLAVTRLDLARLADGLSGDARVGGALTGHAEIDGRGPSLRDVVDRLGGHGQIAIDGGRLAGLSLTQALRGLGRRPPLTAERSSTPTVFDHALWDVSVAEGIVKIPEGKLTARGVAMTFGAEAALPDGRIDVHAVATQTDRGGLPLEGSQRLPFDMRGSWAGPLVLFGHGLPVLVLPSLGGEAPLR